MVLRPYYPILSPSHCSNTNFVNYIHSGEGVATYDFCPTSSPDLPTITVPDPELGTWKVEYFSTVTGTQTEHFSITAEDCVPTPEEGTQCSTFTIFADQSISSGQKGTGWFKILSNTITSTPQFPLGLYLLSESSSLRCSSLGRSAKAARKARRMGPTISDG